MGLKLYEVPGFVMFFTGGLLGILIGFAGAVGATVYVGGAYSACVASTLLLFVAFLR